VQREGAVERYRGDIVVVACGAINSAALLLRSANWAHPDGLANGSGVVGRHYMCHNNSALIALSRTPNPTRFQKTLGLNDFYFRDGQKYGTVQSFGAIPPMEWLTNRPGRRGKALRLMSPAVRRIYERFFTGGLVLAAMTEDLPYLDNRVLPSDRPSLDGRQRLRIQYRLHASEIERRAAFLRQLKEVLDPFRKITLGSGKGNANLGHVCGTCRFGTDPKTSVLNKWNQVWDAPNVFVTDGACMTSAACQNPSLTYMALTARAVDFAVGELKKGNI